MKLKICEICQETKFLTEEKIKEAVTKRNINKYAYILHDKDVDEQGNLKHAHWHICLKFADSQDTKYVAGWFGIEQQYVNKSKSGHFEDMLLYLTHMNACEKYQYSPDDVRANFDYKNFIEKNGKLLTRKEEIVEKIASGEIKEYNYAEYISPNDYVKYGAQIEKAFKYRRDKIYTGNRNLEVIYITGGSSTGKTTFAKMLAEKKGYSFYLSSSDNDILDGYKGEDCLILDDLRGSAMRFSDFIKMIDNNTDTRVKSRYYNKSITECKLIIITTIHSMLEFYSNIFSAQDEPLLQFQRRCKTYIEMDPYYVNAYSFDLQQAKYVPAGKFVNPTRELIAQTMENVRDEKAMEEFLSMESIKPITSLNLKKGTTLNGIYVPF